MTDSQSPEIAVLVNRARQEFLEMPGLRLTVPQASRLWHLDPPVCVAVLDALVNSTFLRRVSGGAVVRVS